MGKILKRVKGIRIRVISNYILAILLIVSVTSPLYGSVAPSNAKKDSIVLSYSFNFDQPVFKDVALNDEMFTRVSIRDCFSYGVSGNPSLPVFPVKILIPQDKTVSDVNVVCKNVVDVNHDLSMKPVVPQQEPVTIGVNAKRASFKMDKNIYSSGSPIVDKFYSNLDVGFCRGYSILSLDLNPMQYIPSNGRVSYYPEMKVNIKLKDADQINCFYRNNLEDEEWVKNLVSNPDDTDYYGGSTLPTFEYANGLCNSSDEYDYVIITTTENGLDDWATNGSVPYNWSSLMDKHSVEDGFNCTLVTIQEIAGCSDYWNDTALFNDTAAQIREFCKDAYQDWGTSYTLIGGDDEWLPAREMDYAFESDVDSDIYWNHLDGTFNDDGDSSWGEESDSGFDLYAEMYIGRVTCDEPQDVSNWLNKSFYYTDQALIDYLENAAFYGGDTTWEVEGDDFMEYSAINGTSDWLGPNPGSHGDYPSWLGFNYGFETWNTENPGTPFNLSVKWTAEPPNTGWQGGSLASAVTGLKNAINNNDVTLLSGIAHANEDMSLDVSSSTWESDYHNTRPFFIHDYGCHSGDMDAADDGVLHSMLFHSDTELAFACVYNTGYGWGSWDDTNASSALQQKLFWDYFFDLTNNSGSTNNWQLGKAMAYSKDSMAPTINWTYGGAPGSWRGIIQGCLLFGDPAQKLKVPALEQNISLSNENPTNGSTGVTVGNITLGISVNDAESDTMNISFYTNESGTWLEIGSNNSQQNGNYTQTYSFDNYSTKYWWSVNVTDITGSSGWTNETYCFTTRAIHGVSQPDNFQANAYNRTQINLTWAIGNNATHTYIEKNTSSNWSKGEGTEIYNGTSTSLSDQNLTSNTTYYYQAWSWDNIDTIWNTSYVSASNTTTSNTIPTLSDEVPENNSVNQSFNPTLSITINDLDEDLMNVSFWTNNTGAWGLIGTNESCTDGSYSQTNDTFNSYSTKYWWSVNCTDDSNWTNETYCLTTIANQAPTLSNETPTNGSNDVSITLSVLNITITDSEGHNFDWTVETNVSISNSSANNDSDGVKLCNISCLNYSITYYWYVNVTDNYSWTKEWYSFTTESAPLVQNNATVISNESPSNGSTGVSTSLSTLSVSIVDSENDSFNWSIKTKANIGNNSGNNASNGTKSCTISGLSYSTTYYWFVNATDSGNGTWVNNTYHFQTRSQPAPPGGGGIIQPTNNPPSTPSTPDGPTEGYTNTSYNYSTTGTDSNNDQIKYRFDWGDDSLSDWTELVDSGTQITLSHSWSTNGTYHIKAKTMDDNGAESDWSDILAVTISQPVVIEEPEEIEVIVDIPENVITNNSCSFTITEISEEENLTYQWDFGDGKTGTEKQPNHIYSESGTYTVTLTVYDSNGQVVNTTTFQVTIDPAGSTQQTEENQQEGQNWFLIGILFFISLFVILLAAFRNTLKSVFTSQSPANKYPQDISNIRLNQEEYQKYQLEPKKSPLTYADLNYDHDIKVPKTKYPTSQKVIGFSDINLKDEVKIKDMREFLDKIDIEEVIKKRAKKKD